MVMQIVGVCAGACASNEMLCKAGVLVTDDAEDDASSAKSSDAARGSAEEELSGEKWIVGVGVG
jgi:hypothetical protein